MVPLFRADDEASRAEAPVEDPEAPTFVAKLEEARVRAPEAALYEERIAPDWRQTTVLATSFAVLVLLAVLAPVFLPANPGRLRIFVLAVAVIQAMLAAMLHRIRFAVHADRITVQQGPFRRSFPIEQFIDVEEGRRGFWRIQVRDEPLGPGQILRYTNRIGRVLVLYREADRAVVVSPANVDAAMAAVRARLDAAATRSTFVGGSDAGRSSSPA